VTALQAALHPATAPEAEAFEPEGAPAAVRPALQPPAAAAAPAAAGAAAFCADAATVAAAAAAVAAVRQPPPQLLLGAPAAAAPSRALGAAPAARQPAGRGEGEACRVCDVVAELLAELAPTCAALGVVAEQRAPPAPAALPQPAGAAASAPAGAGRAAGARAATAAAAGPAPGAAALLPRPVRRAG